MADKSLRLEFNVPGTHYVTDECIDCGMCHSNWPGFFALNRSSGFSYVHRQPASLEEMEAANEAVDSCPVDAIGNDG